MASQLSHDEVQDALITDLREVLFMQAGFALIEMDSVSEQNTQRVMMKNVADALVGKKFRPIRDSNPGSFA
eukprot:g34779.t1